MISDKAQMEFRIQIYELLDSFKISDREKFITLMSAVVVAANFYVDRNLFFAGMHEMYDQMEEYNRCQQAINQI